jgi:hypothetical protein
MACKVGEYGTAMTYIVQNNQTKKLSQVQVQCMLVGSEFQTNHPSLKNVVIASFVQQGSSFRRVISVNTDLLAPDLSEIGPGPDPRNRTTPCTSAHPNCTTNYIPPTVPMAPQLTVYSPSNSYLQPYGSTSLSISPDAGQYDFESHLFGSVPVTETFYVRNRGRKALHFLNNSGQPRVLVPTGYELVEDIPNSQLKEENGTYVLQPGRVATFKMALKTDTLNSNKDCAGWR